MSGASIKGLPDCTSPLTTRMQLALSTEYQNALSCSLCFYVALLQNKGWVENQVLNKTSVKVEHTQAKEPTRQGGFEAPRPLPGTHARGRQTYKPEWILHQQDRMECQSVPNLSEAADLIAVAWRSHSGAGQVAPNSCPSKSSGHDCRV